MTDSPRIDETALAQLKDRIEKADRSSKAIDIMICEALLGGVPRYDGDECPEFVMSYSGSVDAALSLVSKVLPNTETHRYHGCVWFGHRPAARIFYDVRDDQAEGGWAIGALNDWEVYGATPALALLSALLSAIEPNRGGR